MLSDQSSYHYEWVAFLVAFYYAFEAYNPQCIWSHFCGISLFTKNVSYTPGLSTCSLSFQFSTPVLHKSWDRKLNVCLGSIDFFFFGQFNFVSLSNSIELNLWIECDWNLLWLGSIYYARRATRLWHGSDSHSTSCFCGLKQNSSIILIYYINTSEISGFSLLLENHIFITCSEDTTFIFHVWGYWCRHGFFLYIYIFFNNIICK